MSDLIIRASSVVAWAHDKNRAPRTLYDEGRTTDLRPSELSAGHLVVSDDQSGKVYEAEGMGSIYYVDIGTEDERLRVESRGTEHRITDRETDIEYTVKVDGNDVIIKAPGVDTTLQVY
jgi:hypothetical protein